MKSRNPDQLINELIEREGGYVNHPLDRGGETKYGVTIRTLNGYLLANPLEPKVKIIEVTKELAARIFKSEYFYKPHFDVLPDLVQGLMFDSGVLYGRRTSVKWLQRIVGAKDDGDLGPNTERKVWEYLDKVQENLYLELIKQRISYTANIVVRRPNQIVFLNGWMNRTLEFL